MKDHPLQALRASEVYDRLLSDIVSQKLVPGSRLNVDKLARELSLSQTPIRQALARLQSEGLVLNVPNSGFKVSPLPSKAWFLNSLHFRLVVEPEAARLAALNLTDDRLAKLRAVLDRMEVCKTGDADSYGDFSAADQVFHGLIATFSENEVIVEALENVRRKMIGFRLSFPTDLRTSLQAEHHKVFNQIAERSPSGAFGAMHAHISSTIKWVHGAKET